jgi:hypothetical protein
VAALLGLDTLSMNIESILSAHHVLQTMLPATLTQLQDQSLPLDQRWDAYTQLVEKNILVNEANFGDGLLSQVFDANKVSLYDDFNMERYETRTMPEIWEKITDEDGDMDAYADPVKRDQWRELVLASGLSGFEHDW